MALQAHRAKSLAQKAAEHPYALNVPRFTVGNDL